MIRKNLQEITPGKTPHGEVVYEYFGMAAGGTTQHSLAHIVLEPHAASLKHYHPAVEESYYILSGQPELIVDGEAATLNPGDAIAIPLNAVHQIINHSDEEIHFIAICTPPWTPDCSVFID